MSNLVFPKPATLIGETWPVIRTPIHSTLIQTSASGLEARVPLYAYPRYKWELQYDFLSDSALLATWQTLVGFYNLHHGRWDSFRFQDPYDHDTRNAQIGRGTLGIGDGTTQSFQAARQIGGATDLIYEIDQSAPPVFYVNGGGTSASVNSSGLVTYGGVPPAGAPVQADFAYWFRVRFDDDSLDFENFAETFWSLKKLTLMGVRA